MEQCGQETKGLYCLVFCIVTDFPGIAPGLFAMGGGGDMTEYPKTIYIRRGLNGYPYAAFTAAGGFICNFDRLADARKHWYIEIRLGYVNIVRELTKYPE